MSIYSKIFTILLVTNLFTINSYSIITGLREEQPSQVNVPYPGDIRHLPTGSGLLGVVINNNNTGIEYKADISHTFNNNTMQTNHILKTTDSNKITVIVEKLYPYIITITNLQQVSSNESSLQHIITNFFKSVKNVPNDLKALTYFYSSSSNNDTKLTCEVNEELFDKYKHQSPIQLSLIVDHGEFILQGCE